MKLIIEGFKDSRIELGKEYSGFNVIEKLDNQILCTRKDDSELYIFSRETGKLIYPEGPWSLRETITVNAKTQISTIKLEDLGIIPGSYVELETDEYSFRFKFSRIQEGTKKGLIDIKALSGSYEYSNLIENNWINGTGIIRGDWIIMDSVDLDEEEEAEKIIYLRLLE